MATETASAKTFLNTLSSLPIIHSTDSTPDPRTFSPNAAFILAKMPKPYALPTSTSGSTSQSRRITVSIKPLRPIPTIPSGTSVELEGLGASTSVWEVKQQLAGRTGYSVEKVKLLLQRKPVGDAKTLSELLTPAEGEEAGHKQVLELSAMFTGTPTETPVADGDAEKGGKEASAGVQTADKAALDAAKAKYVGKAGGVEGAPGEAGTQDVEMAEGDGSTAAMGASGTEVLKTEAFWEDLRGFMVQRTRDEKTAETFVKKCRDGWAGWFSPGPI